VIDWICVSCWAEEGTIQDVGGHTRRKEIILEDLYMDL